MAAKLVGKVRFSGKNCPKCGARIVTNEYGETACSYQSCDYGIVAGAGGISLDEQINMLVRFQINRKENGAISIKAGHMTKEQHERDLNVIRATILTLQRLKELVLGGIDGEGYRNTRSSEVERAP